MCILSADMYMCTVYELYAATCTDAVVGRWQYKLSLFDLVLEYNYMYKCRKIFLSYKYKYLKIGRPWQLKVFLILPVVNTSSI